MTELDQGMEQVDLDSEGTTGEALQNEGEQSASTQTTQVGSDDTFFDPNDLPDELIPAYKQMQASYTKKMQNISGNKEKLEAYDAFAADPIGTLQKLSQQYGYQMVQGSKEQTEWQPQSWDEVMAKAKQEALKELAPVIGDLRKSNMETRLDKDYPDWRQYEDEMVNIVTKHPTLAQDPDMLYHMALPKKVIEGRAMKQALAKVNGQSQAAQVSGKSTTNKSPNQKPTGSLSLDEAVKYAKAELAKKGIRPPADY